MAQRCATRPRRLRNVRRAWINAEQNLKIGRTNIFVLHKELWNQCADFEPTNPRITWMGGAIAALDGDREKALLTIKKIEDARMGPVGSNYVGYIYHALGDLDSFFE